MQDKLDALINKLNEVPRLYTCVGSIGGHHGWEGGLWTHTQEVAYTARAMSEIARLNGTEVDQDVVDIAALLHDLGKLDVYQKHEDKWRKDPSHKTHHTHFSIIRARSLMNDVGLDAPFIDHVLDCIASHHGNIEHGALHEPRTKEAWIVHFADVASAVVMGKHEVRSK